MLTAMTTADVVRYVSVLDSAKKKTETQRDPNDASKGVKVDYDIDWTKASVFNIHALDVFLMGHIFDRVTSMQGAPGASKIDMQTQVNRANMEAVRFGLGSWEKFNDKDGNLAVFKTKKFTVGTREYIGATDDTLGRLGDIRLVTELAENIRKLSEVDRDEEKNSEGASPQSG